MELTLKSFKALSSATRIIMLRELKRRRMTTTELAGLLNVHVTTAKEHLSVLQDAGLVIKAEDGHKWKYYALTHEGQEIISPYPREIKIMLFISLLLVGVGLLGMSTLGLTVGTAAGPNLMAESRMAPAMETRAVVKTAPEAGASEVREEPRVGAGMTQAAETAPESGTSEEQVQKAATSAPPAEEEGRLPLTPIVFIVVGAAGIGAAIGIARGKLNLTVKKP